MIVSIAATATEVVVKGEHTAATGSVLTFTEMWEVKWPDGECTGYFWKSEAEQAIKDKFGEVVYKAVDTQLDADGTKVEGQWWINAKTGHHVALLVRVGFGKE